MGTQPSKVRCMTPGIGGTFKLGRNPGSGERVKPEETSTRVLHSGEYLGTQKCKSDVGVYFEIGENLCFCAHISIVDYSFSHDQGIRRANEEEFDRIARHVYRKLHQHRSSQGWEVKDINKDTLVTACVSPERGGQAVLTGIHAFIKGGKGSIVVNDKPGWAHGFIVQPGSGRGGPYVKRLLLWKYRALPKQNRFGQDKGFEMCEGEYELEKDWCYSLTRGWIDPLEVR